MAIEQNTLISLLELTKKGSVSIETIKREARVTSDFALKFIKEMENEGTIYVQEGKLATTSQSRVKIAVKALCIGADFERVSKYLNWQEFEEIAVVALEENGYLASKNVRFKHRNHRFEIDVIGCKAPTVLCIDCKHWSHGIYQSALEKIVDAQVKRTRAFADSLPMVRSEIECVKWRRAKFVPAILSLVHGKLKFHVKTPIIPVLQLQDFISQLPAYSDSLRHFTKDFRRLTDNS